MGALAVAILGSEFELLGVIPGAPGSVGVFGADAGGGSGEVTSCQRHHRERGVLAEFADGLTAAESGEGLLDEDGVLGYRPVVTM